MAASTNATALFTNSSAANFRAWGLSMHNAIIAGGWVDNGDSGQIDFTTVAAPAGVDTSQGYKIYRSNDSGGGLVNYYVKLEFGSGTTSLNRPAVWVTFGFQGTDGAGTLLSTINPISTRTQVASGATPAGATISINQSAGSGYICICGTSSLANENLMFSLERTRDTSQAFQNQVSFIATKVGTLGTGASPGATAQVVDTLNAYPINGNGVLNQNSIAPNANSPVGGIVALGLLFGMAPGATSPSMNVFGVESGALGVYQDTIPVTILGSTHQYKLQRDVVFAGQASTVLLTRFE